ncbi:MAG: GvpL/GvpF family gas vesicle protein [Thermoleophilia bacterium]|nr:GvpL/GvpF family gas vesicle protein [Thermoleophilia bacterium]
MSPEPTEARAGFGVYVYGVLPAKTASVPPDLVGLDDRHRVTVCAHEGLAAIVSRVALDEFGEERLRDNLARPEWLEQRVRGHERVLEAFLEAPALLPLRFGAIFRGDEQVQAMLAENADAFAAALERMRGRREWSVKAFVDRQALIEQLAASGGAGGGARGEGHAYFARKQRERDARERAHTVAAALAEELHETLAEAASADTYLPARSDAPDLVLNAAYLVERAQESSFLRVVQEAARERQPGGMRVEITGPWPPYSFVGRDEDAP